MEKVDKTIDAICDWIIKEIDGTDILNCADAAEMTKALAELVSARAQDVY